VHKRREHLLAELKKKRTERREQGEPASSSDEEKDTRRVDADIQGMVRQALRPVQSRNRTRTESKALESLLMDPEGVHTRRELLLAELKKKRTERREQGEPASSSDEEKDMRRVHADYVGLPRLRPSLSRKR